MKRILLVVVTVLLSTPTFGQSKLDGIGIFRLGMNEEVFLSKIDSLGYKLEECNNANNTGCTPSYLHYSEISKGDISIYSVGGYEVAGIYIKTLMLYFYNKELYSIKISNQSIAKLYEGLDLKYGPFSMEKEESKTFCFIYGETFEFPQTTYTSTYENGDIKMLYLAIYTRDAKCNKTILEGFELYNTQIKSIISQKQKEEDERKEKEENEKKRKALNDL